ncbi:hypothetical protein EI555_021554 [Monodon monoceros]|uniref:Uncharacterized protein n=1 Tax=Monodon monoceros TaxID=40151 RepID=A0A4U1ENZ6_MONMO|nr:hypothetical protein EI555_021554 [Monodon monoceros]
MILLIRNLCYTTEVPPKMLAHFVPKRKTISVMGCFLQFHFFIVLVITNYYMLTVMVYYHCMATCKPLLYDTYIKEIAKK